MLRVSSTLLLPVRFYFYYFVQNIILDLGSSIIGVLHTDLHANELLSALKHEATALVSTTPTPLNILTPLAGSFILQQRRARSGKWSFVREHFRYLASGAIDFVADDAVERIAFDADVDTSLDLSAATEQITTPAPTNPTLSADGAEKGDAMRTLTTFNLGLDLRPEERQAKNAVVLPFQKASQGPILYHSYNFII